jgi:hypothetical protein
MSEVSGFTLTQLFIRNSSLSGTAQLVAIVIADKYDQRKGYASASSRLIARSAGISTNTVTAALIEIEESGEWIVEKAKGATTRYYPVVSKVSQRQEKRAKKNTRTITSGENRPARSNTEPAKDILDAESHVPEAILYPETPEDTNPYLDGLPLLPEAGVQDGRFVNPAVLTDPLSMAVRLHRRTDIKSRVKQKEFTVENLTNLITSLAHTGAPLEIIDILLWIQCENRKPLNESFLAVVLAKCTNNGVIIKPVKWYQDKEDPALETAKMVYDVYQARHATSSSAYSESL